MTQKHRIIASNIIYGIIVFLVVLLSCVYYNAQSVKPDNERAKNLNVGWYYLKDGHHQLVTLPLYLPADKELNSDLYRVIPLDGGGRYICFLSWNEKVTMSLDGIQFYEWSGKNLPKWLTAPGMFYHVARIPDGSGGKTLCIHTQAGVKKTAGCYLYVCMGTKNAIFNTIRHSQLIQFASALFLFAVGCVLLIITLLFFRALADDKTMLHLSAFTIVLSVWLLEQSRMLQLFIGSPVIHWAASYLTLLVMPIPYMLLVEQVSGTRNNGGIQILFFSNIAVIIASLVLQLTGIVQCSDSIIAMYVFYVICGVYALYLLLTRSRHAVKSIRYSFYSFYVFSAGCAVQVICYYLTGRRSYLFVDLSLLIFIMILTYYTGKQAMERITQTNKENDLQRLAFTDMQTGVFNRTSFYTYIEQFEPRDGRPEEFCIMIFDMNNLKYINDNFGHSAGDMVIKQFAICAKSAFGKIGKLYRIGGDEFVCLISGVSDDIVINSIGMFDEMVANSDKNGMAFTAAYGYTWFSPHRSGDFYKALKESDDKMYAMKRTMKSRAAQEAELSGRAGAAGISGQDTWFDRETRRPGEDHL